MHKSKTKHYNVWKSMKGRCYCKTHTSYIKYGAKGITVCDDWLNSYEDFLEWSILSGYKEGLTLDRIDGTRGYHPDNCRFVGYREQNLNLNKKTSKTGFINVFKHNGGTRYGFRVRVSQEFRYLSPSIYDTAKEAAIAYNKYCDDNGLKNKRNVIE